MRTKYYHEFDEFKGTIDSIIDDSSTKDKRLIDRLIGEKVQLFDDVPIIQNEVAKVKKKRANSRLAPSNDLIKVA